MEALDAIMTRRSIRKYKDKRVPDDLLQKMLAAGMAAPSAHNEQPWHFVVITDKKLLSQIPGFSPHAQMALQAPVAILVCGDSSLEKGSGFLEQDCSNATENILLAAHALGLGAVWTAVYPSEDRIAGFRKMLGLPQSIAPFALLPIGYPDEKPEQQDRFKKERIHYDKW